MDHADVLGSGTDGRLQQVLVEIQRVGADVDEYGARAAQHKSVGGGDEGEGRDDHFIAGANIEQQGSHFERVGAGSGQQCLLNAERFFEELVAFAGEKAVAGDLHAGEGFFDV